jgi:uroporphyrinogen III methyltransferase/synthase
MNTAEALDVPVGVPPLADRTLVVTRPKLQAEELAEALEARGARVVRLPTIEIGPPSDPGPLEAAARGESDYDWMIFTSANGVLALKEASVRVDSNIGRAVGEARVCCVGPATAQAAEAAGLSVSLIPEIHVAEGVVDVLAASADIRGLRMLLPVAAGARDVLPRGLRALGAVVVDVAAYETMPVEEADEGMLALLQDGVDLVTFTSPSSVRGFSRLVDGPPVAPAAVIGPVTASAARDHGYDVTVQAGDFTVMGLVEAVVCHYTDERADESG